MFDPRIFVCALHLRANIHDLSRHATRGEIALRVQDAGLTARPFRLHGDIAASAAVSN